EHRYQVRRVRHNGEMADALGSGPSGFNTPVQVEVLFSASDSVGVTPKRRSPFCTARRAPCATRARTLHLAAMRSQNRVLGVASHLPLCRWYDLGWSFRVTTKSEGEGPDSPSRGRGVRISRGERSPWDNGESVREPSGLDEPRRIEPGPGRTDRGAWWSRRWSRGGCWRWGSGSSRSPRPTAPRSGSHRAPTPPSISPPAAPTKS